MSVIAVGIFRANCIDERLNKWELMQGEKQEAVGSLDFVLGIMFDRLRDVSLRNIKRDIENGSQDIRCTITSR